MFDCDMMGARSRSVVPAMCITQRSMIDIIKLGGPGDRLSDDLSVDCALFTLHVCTTFTRYITKNSKSTACGHRTAHRKWKKLSCSQAQMDQATGLSVA